MASKKKAVPDHTKNGTISYDADNIKLGYVLDNGPFRSPHIKKISKRSALFTDEKGVVHTIFILEEEKIEFSETHRYVYHLMLNQIENLYKFIEHMIETCCFFINRTKR